MRNRGLVFAGAMAALIALASPGYAKTASLNSHANANAQSSDEQTDAPSGCHAYQQKSDGSWVQMACHEGAGQSAVAPVRGKSPNHRTTGEVH